MRNLRVRAPNRALFLLDRDPKASRRLATRWGFEATDDDVKISAKRLLKERAPDVPLIPGYNGENQAVDVLIAEAIRVGTRIGCLSNTQGSRCC
jgi:hypothetical protein